MNYFCTAEEALAKFKEYFASISGRKLRAEMPQISEIAHTSGKFASEAQKQGLQCTNEKLLINADANTIIPIQKDLHFKQVSSLLQDLLSDNKKFPNKPLIVIDDGTYKLAEGHHMWGALWCLSCMLGRPYIKFCVIIKGDLEETINKLNIISRNIANAPITPTEKDLPQDCLAALSAINLTKKKKKPMGRKVAEIPLEDYFLDDSEIMKNFEWPTDENHSWFLT